MLLLLALAGLCLVLGMLAKFMIIPYKFIDTLPRTYLEFAQLLVLVAIALGIYDLLGKK